MALRTARTSIYIDAVKFFNIAYEGQFEMDKRDRIVLANRLLQQVQPYTGFLVEHKRLHRLDEAQAGIWQHHVPLEQDQ